MMEAAQSLPFQHIALFVELRVDLVSVELLPSSIPGTVLLGLTEYWRDTDQLNITSSHAIEIPQSALTGQKDFRFRMTVGNFYITGQTLPQPFPGTESQETIISLKVKEIES